MGFIAAVLAIALAIVLAPYLTRIVGAVVLIVLIAVIFFPGEPSPTRTPVTRANESAPLIVPVDDEIVVFTPVDPRTGLRYGFPLGRYQ